MKFIYFLLSCLYIAPFCLNANVYAYNGDCKLMGDMSVFEDCLNTELSKYDRELNIIYRGLLKGSNNKQLNKTEMLWIKFKEKDCEYMAREVDEGREYSVIRTVCLIDKTRTRIVDLKRSYFYSNWFQKRKTF